MTWLASWWIEFSDKYLSKWDLTVPLMLYDPSDLGSYILIWINRKERTLNKEKWRDYSLRKA